jgi:hypothetical protein
MVAHSDPPTAVTTITQAYPPTQYDMAHIIVEFKGKEYRVQKGGPAGPGLNVFTKRGRGYYALKSMVGQGAFKDMLKVTKGLKVPPGYRRP